MGGSIADHGPLVQHWQKNHLMMSIAKFKNIPVLNGIRGLAVLIVFASHGSNVFFGGRLLGDGGGQLGVMLFFMLSGFLMALLYMGESCTRQAIRNFLVNRFARIYPMFALVVVGCFVVNQTRLQFWVYPVKTSLDLLEHLSFIRGYNVLWTIGPEIIFYMLFLALWKIRNASNRQFIGVIAILACLAWLPINTGDTNALFALHNKLPFFMVGCLLGTKSESMLRIVRGGSERLAMTAAFWASVAMFLLSMPQVFNLMLHASIVSVGDSLPDPWANPLYLILTASLLVTAIISRPWILTNRVIGFVGKISFSFYLLHFAVLMNMYVLMPTHPLRAIALTATVTFALSSLSYLIIEVPLRNLIRTFGKSHVANTLVTVVQKQ